MNSPKESTTPCRVTPLAGLMDGCKDCPTSRPAVCSVPDGSCTAISIAEAQAREIPVDVHRPVVWVDIRLTAEGLFCGLAAEQKEAILQPLGTCNHDDRSVNGDGIIALGGNPHQRMSCDERTKAYAAGGFSWGHIGRNVEPEYELGCSGFMYGLVVQNPLTLMASAVQTYRYQLSEVVHWLQMASPMADCGAPCDHEGPTNLRFQLFDNYLVRMLSGDVGWHCPPKRINVSHFEHAMLALSRMDVIVVLEKLKVDRLQLSTKFGWVFEPQSNEEKDSPLDGSPSIGLLGDNLKYLTALNKWDRQLYRAAIRMSAVRLSVTSATASYERHDPASEGGDEGDIASISDGSSIGDASSFLKPSCKSADGLVVITALYRGAEGWDEESLCETLASFAQTNPNREIVVWDLEHDSKGHSRSQAEAIAKCKLDPCVDLRPFPFEEFPFHVSMVRYSAWLPLAIDRVLRTWSMVLWVEPGTLFVGQLAGMYKNLPDRAVIAGVGVEDNELSLHSAIKMSHWFKGTDPWKVCGYDYGKGVQVDEQLRQCMVDHDMKIMADGVGEGEAKPKAVVTETQIPVDDATVAARVPTLCNASTVPKWSATVGSKLKKCATYNPVRPKLMQTTAIFIVNTVEVYTRVVGPWIGCALNSTCCQWTAELAELRLDRNCRKLLPDRSDERCRIWAGDLSLSLAVQRSHRAAGAAGGLILSNSEAIIGTLKIPRPQKKKVDAPETGSMKKQQSLTSKLQFWKKRSKNRENNTVLKRANLQGVRDTREDVVTLSQPQDQELPSADRGSNSIHHGQFISAIPLYGPFNQVHGMIESARLAEEHGVRFLASAVQPHFIELKNFNRDRKVATGLDPTELFSPFFLLKRAIVLTHESTWADVLSNIDFVDVRTVINFKQGSKDLPIGPPVVRQMPLSKWLGIVDYNQIFASLTGLDNPSIANTMVQVVLCWDLQLAAYIAQTLKKGRSVLYSNKYDACGMPGACNVEVRRLKGVMFRMPRLGISAPSFTSDVTHSTCAVGVHLRFQDKYQEKHGPRMNLDAVTFEQATYGLGDWGLKTRPGFSSGIQKVSDALKWLEHFFSCTPNRYLYLTMPPNADVRDWLKVHQQKNGAWARSAGDFAWTHRAEVLYSIPQELLGLHELLLDQARSAACDIALPDVPSSVSEGIDMMRAEMSVRGLVAYGQETAPKIRKHYLWLQAQSGYKKLMQSFADNE
jgi:hypothetical protein